MSSASDFIIENGVLKKYVGPGGDVVIPEGIRSIARDVLPNKALLVSLSIPEGVAELNSRTFSRCTSLQEVRLPASLRIIHGTTYKFDDGTFESCRELKRVFCSEGLAKIGTNAFAYCEKLEEIRIPDSVSYIGSSVFHECSRLEHLCIPQAVSSLYPFTFWGCNSLKRVDIMGKIDEFSDRAFANPTKALICAPNMLIKDIPSPFRRNALRGFAQMRQEGVPISKEIADSYIRYCKNQRKKLYDLIAVDLPLLQLMLDEKLIPAEDFDALNETALAQSEPAVVALLLEYIKNNQPTAGSRKREKLTLSGNTPTVADLKNSWTYKKLEDGTLRLNAYKGNETDIVVPAVIGKARVSAIGDFCFSPDAKGAVSQEQVRIRKEIRSIIIPESITHVGESAFRNCTGLEKIEIPAQTELGQSALYGCVGLADPQGLILHGGIVYGYCGQKSSVEIPEGVTKIDVGTFRNCTTLTQILIPKTVTQIAEHAFSGCTSLKQLCLEGIENIGVEAFLGCKMLEVIHISGALFRLHYGVFANCPVLKDVHLTDAVGYIESWAFGSRRKFTIHAPAGSHAETYAKYFNIPFVAE